MNSLLPKVGPYRARDRWMTMNVVLCYVALVIAFTWPAVTQLSSSVARSDGSDAYLHMWNHWWVRHSLVDLHQNPYTTTYLNHPTGLPLTYHVLDPLNGIISTPFQETFGLVLTYNALRLAHLLFAALATYALCRLLRVSPAAAWLGGALYACSPIVSGHFNLGALIEISVGWMPLYLFLLIKGLGNRALTLRPGRPAFLVGAGFALAASALSTWYFFFNLLIFTALYVSWELGSWFLDRKRNREGVGDSDGNEAVQLIGRALAVAATAFLALSPLLIAAGQESAQGEVYMLPSLEALISNSADLLSFFLPAPAHFNISAINPLRVSPALGWTVIALATVGFLTRHSFTSSSEVERTPNSNGLPHAATLHAGRTGAYRPLFWLSVSLVFTSLALGPQLLVAGNNTGVPMPYSLLSQLPLVGAGRAPARFVFIASLCAAILAGFGIAYIERRVRSHRLRFGAFPLYAVVGALAALELLAIPRGLSAMEVHPFYSTIRVVAGERERGAVLQLPLSTRTGPAMLDQTTHQRPIIGGFTSRHYPYPWLDTTPGIAQLAAADPDAINARDIYSPSIGTAALPALDYYDVRYIAVYPTDPSPLGARARETAEQIFNASGVPPIFSDAAMTVWRVPTQPRTGPFVGLGQGWYGVEGEGSAQDRRWRWTNGDAHVHITNPTEGEMSAVVELSAYTVAEPRTLLVLVDGREVTRHTISPHPAQPLSIDVTLSPGEHWLRLRSLEPAEKPPGDSRAIGIGFERVEVRIK